MRIVVDINHPGHVHYFNNFIRKMRGNGHQVLITASKKDVTFQLLDSLGFEYKNLGTYGNNAIQKALSIIKMDIKMYDAIKDFNPDILIGFSSCRVAHVSRLISKPSIIFDDTEHAKFEHLLYKSFASAILTPSCFKKDMGKKHIRFKGYMELAALHPNYFQPNPEVLREIDIGLSEPFIIVRFVSWQAGHDVGHHGIRDKSGFVKALGHYGRVLITSEGTLPPELQPFQILISPDKLHDLLHYARLYVGEGGTTAAEAALLETPSIFVSSLAGSMGNFIELEDTYGLIFSFTDSHEALDRARDILKDPLSKEKWRVKRKRLMEDKIDVTAFMTWFIENYPKSYTMMKDHPEVQNSFTSAPGDAI
jgi:uncharacterized protein